jgi:spermidine synthase
LLAGVTFPTLLCVLSAVDHGPSSTQLGRLLAINGLGGIMGAEVATRFLLPWTGVHVALGVVGGCYSLCSAGLLLALRRKSVLPWIICLVAAAGTFWLLGTTLQSLPIFLRASTFQVVEVRSGSEGSLAVVERTDLGRAMFFDNLYLLGSSRAAPDLERQAHVPLLLHPHPSEVGFAGLGTGITAAGALRHDAVGRITAVELSPLTVRAAARHFREFNQALCENSKVRVHAADAGPFFASVKERFDVIIGDLFVPWRPGEARLCSLEQFQAAYNALLPEGVFCQWLAMSQLTEDEFEIIVATFQRVFDKVHLFRNHFKTGSSPLALVGFKQGQLSWDVVDRRCRAERLHGRLRDPVCRFPEGLALLYLGICKPKAVFVHQLNTLGNLRVELAAGRHMLVGTPSDYFHGISPRWLNFLERQVGGIETSPAIPDSLRRFPRTGLLATRCEIACQAVETSAPALLETLRSELPNAMLTDPAVDWSFWAGDPLQVTAFRR